MASKTTYHCDRCGVEFKKEGLTRFLHYHRKLTDFLWYGYRCEHEKTYDLCQNCTKDFFNFIYEGRKNNG